MPTRHEEVWVHPLDSASNRSIADSVQASDEDFAWGVLVDGKPCNLIRVASESALRELRAARENGTIKFREVRKASPGSAKRDVTVFTTSAPRSRGYSRKTVQALIASGVIRPASTLAKS